MPTGLISLLLAYSYALIVPVAIVGGPPFAILLGIMVRFSTLYFIPTYFCLMAGELIGDVAWYWIGYKYGERFMKRFGKYVSITEGHVDAVKNMFEKYHMRILTISKLTTGLGFAPIVLFTAGMSKVSFLEYLRINVLWQFIWSLALIGIGYFFGNIYIQVSDNYQRLELIAGFILLLAIVAGFGKYLGKRIIARYSK